MTVAINSSTNTFLYSEEKTTPKAFTPASSGLVKPKSTPNAALSGASKKFSAEELKASSLKNLQEGSRRWAFGRDELVLNHYREKRINKSSSSSPLENPSTNEGIKTHVQMHSGKQAGNNRTYKKKPKRTLSDKSTDYFYNHQKKRYCVPIVQKTSPPGPRSSPSSRAGEAPTDRGLRVNHSYPTESPTEGPTSLPTEAPTSEHYGKHRVMSYVHSYPTESPTEGPTSLPTEDPSMENYRKDRDLVEYSTEVLAHLSESQQDAVNRAMEHMFIPAPGAEYVHCDFSSLTNGVIMSDVHQADLLEHSCSFTVTGADVDTLGSRQVNVLDTANVSNGVWDLGSGKAIFLEEDDKRDKQGGCLNIDFVDPVDLVGMGILNVLTEGSVKITVSPDGSISCRGARKAQCNRACHLLFTGQMVKSWFCFRYCLLCVAFACGTKVFSPDMVFDFCSSLRMRMESMQS